MRRELVARRYHDLGTARAGASGPLKQVKSFFKLQRTGWGPRGDSGSARSRVRATQPAF